MKLSYVPSLSVSKSIRAFVLASGLVACNSTPETPAAADPTTVINSSVATLDRDMHTREAEIDRLEEEIRNRQDQLDDLRQAQRTATEAICRIAPDHRGCPRP